MNRHMDVPVTREEAASLKVGNCVYPAEIIYTTRSATHERVDEAPDRGESPPFDIEGSIMYYMGPSPAREGRVVGSAGLTTVSRMDKHTPYLLDLGMGTMVGKGKKSKAVMDVIVYNGAVYFAAVRGAGAILPRCIPSSETIAYENLDTETVRRLAIQDFPAVVIMDTLGNNLYETAVKESCTLQRGGMERVIYMVLMDLLHAPIWFFTISRMTREENTRTTAEKYGCISEVVERISRRGRIMVTATKTGHTPSQDGFILFPNHQGLFDMPALFSTCSRSLSVVVRKEASNWILIKQVLEAIRGLAMDRDDIKDQVRIVTEVTKRVKPGCNFVTFTEGHRSRNGNGILGFKSDTLKSAVKTGCPIVPVALVNSFHPFDMNSLKREEVQVHYMEPILPDQYIGVKTSGIAHLVHDRIQEEINKSLTKDGLTS